MRRIRVHNWMIVLGGLGIMFVAGCDVSLREAATAGVFDFVAGTVADTLTGLMPIADAVAVTVG